MAYSLATASSDVSQIILPVLGELMSFTTRPPSHDDIDARLKKEKIYLDQQAERVEMLRKGHLHLSIADSVLGIKPTTDISDQSSQPAIAGSHTTYIEATASEASTADEKGDDNTIANDDPQVRAANSTSTISSSDAPQNDSCTDLWDLAFSKLEAREHQLVADYKKHIHDQLHDGQPSEVVLSSPQSVRELVNELVEYREKKQWQFNVFGETVKVREQVENLLKFLVWSDDIIKEAVSSQPHLALAWSSVSILLPVRQCLFTICCMH